MKKKTFAVIGLMLFLGCVGCASLGTYNAATGRRELIFVPTDMEVSMGDQFHEQLQQEFKIQADGELSQRVNRIGQRLAQVSDRQDYEYHFYVIEKDELNAFTVPGGRIYFFTGLLNKLQSDDQIASVLAHEIGHCSAKHTIKKFQAAMGFQLVGDVVLSQLSGAQTARQIASLSSSALMNLVFSAYGRKDEYESDKLGLKYMALAGYNVNGMTEAFEVLDAENKGPDVPLIFRSHPYTRDRITAIQQEIQKMRAEGLIAWAQDTWLKLVRNK